MIPGVPTKLIFKVLVPLLLIGGVGGGYHYLYSELAEARARSDQLRQDRAGLQDSLREVAAEKVTLSDSIEAVRRTYERRDRSNADSLQRIVQRLRTPDDAEASGATEAEINPDSASIAGTSEAKGDTVYVHRVSRRSGLIDFDLSLRVRPPGDNVRYRISANPLARKISLVRYESDDGLTTTRLQITGGTVTSLQGYRPPRDPDPNPGPFTVRPELGLVSGFSEGRPVQPYGALAVSRTLFGPVNANVSGMVAGYPPANFLLKTGVSVDL